MTGSLTGCYRGQIMGCDEILERLPFCRARIPQVYACAQSEQVRQGTSSMLWQSHRISSGIVPKTHPSTKSRTTLKIPVRDAGNHIIGKLACRIAMVLHR